MGLKRESIFFSVMLLLLLSNMATGRVLFHSTSLHADFETMNMDGKNRDGSRFLSSALPRGGNYINKPHAAEKAAVGRAGYQP
ncbi:hypothetical protein Csa_014795 [Cucumis sativus]|uniref:Aconitate hydratase n=1 Tax=Cucumis sativus TaxID=3659 RepID=A0A0A0KXI8_CUCSA|nr:hypothetical protein Csa_014795 [Cucumis sativus]